MANTKAIQFVEGIYRRTDQQVRDILATQVGPAEVNSIEVNMGDGINVMTTGIQAAIRVDFRARITGAFLQEFDGTAGTITVDIQKAPAGPAPAFASIVASDPPTIATAGRYDANVTLTGWNTLIDAGDVLRFHVTAVATFKRVLLSLRIRRLEP